MAQRRIGILTGGGDVPGLNSVIKSVTYSAASMDTEVLGIRRGWMGLTHMRFSEARPGAPDPEHAIALNRENTRSIDRAGGTVLHTSRMFPGSAPQAQLPPHLAAADARRYQTDDGRYDLTPLVVENIERLGLDALIAIGGDGTLRYAEVLHERGIPLVAIPKTMDNDVRNTEYCIGFSTAITRAAELINRQRSTLASHERIGVFRIFGRDAGFTALYTSYVTSARCVIPEHEFDLEHLVELLVEDRERNPANYALVIASEGAQWHGQGDRFHDEKDSYGRPKKINVGEALAREVKQRSGRSTMVADLTYDLRSGEADMMDKMVATTFANIAMDMLREGKTGGMTAVRDGNYAYVPIPGRDLPARSIDVPRLYDTDRFRPQYRGKLGAPMLLDVLAT